MKVLYRKLISESLIKVCRGSMYYDVNNKKMVMDGNQLLLVFRKCTIALFPKNIPYLI